MKPINLSLIATPGSILTLCSCSNKEAAPEKKHREKGYTGVRQGFPPFVSENLEATEIRKDFIRRT